MLKPIAMAMASLALAATFPEEGKGESDFRLRHVQSFIGATNLDDEDLLVFDEFDEPATADDYTGTLPTLGAGVQIANRKGSLELGLDTGGLLSWKSGSTRFAYRDGTTYFRMDTDLVLFEAFIGAYAGINLTDRFRLYAAAGPTLVYGHLDSDNDDEVDPAPHLNGGREIHLGGKDSDIALGGYGRVGMEYLINPMMIIGVSGRYTDTELDFSDVVGKMQVEGTQWFLTFSRRY